MTYSVSASGREPKFCGPACICIHGLCGVLMFALVTLTIALAFIPISAKVSTIAQSSTIVVLPQPSRLSWHSKLCVEIDGPCAGELYHLPCDQIKVDYKINHSTRGVFDFIYCLGNSSFLFIHNEPDAADAFVSSDNELASSDFFDKYNCSNAPSDVDPTHCIHFDREENPASKNVTMQLSRYSGEYYFVRRSSPSIYFRINRYTIAYHESYKQKYFKGKLTKDEPRCFDLQAPFHPWSFDVNEQCLLLNVSGHNCYGSSLHHVDVTPEKRRDILVWPSIVLLLVVVVEILIVLGQRLWFRIKMTKYRGGVQMVEFD